MSRKARMLAMYQNNSDSDEENDSLVSNNRKNNNQSTKVPFQKLSSDINTEPSASKKRHRNENLNSNFSNEAESNSITFSSENPYKTERKYIKSEKKKILSSKQKTNGISNGTGEEKVFTVMFAQAQARMHKKFTNEGELKVNVSSGVCYLHDMEEDIGKIVAFGPLNRGKIDALYPDYEFSWKGKEIKITEQITSTSSELELKNQASRMKITDFKPDPSLAKKIKQPAQKRQCSNSAPKYDTLHTTGKQIFLDQETKSYEIDYFLANKIRPHQITGAQFLFESVKSGTKNDPQGCILADDMGLGKTLTSITLIHTMTDEQIVKRVLILSPSSLVRNWYQEILKWVGLQRIKPTVIDNEFGKPADKIKEYLNMKRQRQSVCIMSYKMFELQAKNLVNKVKFGLLVCDEAHLLKSCKNKVYKLINGENVGESDSCFEFPRRIFLTGTPVQNNLDELRNLVACVNPGYAIDARSFKKRFIDPHKQVVMSKKSRNVEFDSSDSSDSENCPNSENFNDSESETATGKIAISAQKDLAGYLTPVLLRRSSKILEKYLPPLVESVLYFQLSRDEQVVYQEKCDTVERSSSMAAIAELRSHLNSLDSKMKMLENLIDKMKLKNIRVVVASCYRKSLDRIEEMLKRKNLTNFRLDGQTPQDDRNHMVNCFQDNDRSRDVFLLTSRAGGVGLTLSNAGCLILFDLDWNPAVDKQTKARIWRDGQKCNPTRIYRLISAGTIEEKICQRQFYKQHLGEDVISEFYKTSEDEGMNLMKEELTELFTYHEHEVCGTADLVKENKVKGFESYSVLNMEGFRKQKDDMLASFVEEKKISYLLQKGTNLG